MQRDFLEPPEDRLPGQLAAKLDPSLQDALNHPVRREVLRALHRSARCQSVFEIRAALHAYRPGQLRYHLQVLRRSGVIGSDPAGSAAAVGEPRFGSEVLEDGEVKAVLRATERHDREKREARVAVGGSPQLSMFRTPRPIHTIRLRGRTKIPGEQSSE